jgi:hypothetical protein
MSSGFCFFNTLQSTCLWQNTCRTRIGECNTQPNQCVSLLLRLSGIFQLTLSMHFRVFAHPTLPCGCQPPGSPFDAQRAVCNVSPPNGRMFCETNANGHGSTCRVQCDPGLVAENFLSCTELIIHAADGRTAPGRPRASEEIPRVHAAARTRQWAREQGLHLPCTERPTHQHPRRKMR